MYVWFDADADTDADPYVRIWCISVANSPHCSYAPKCESSSICLVGMFVGVVISIIIVIYVVGVIEIGSENSANC